MNQCPTCNAPVLPDQRYCLNCGTGVSGPRVDFRRELALGDGTAGQAEPPPESGDRRHALMMLTTAAALLLALGVGIVIGRGNGPAAPTRAQVVTVAGAGGGSASGTPVAQISDDWGAGSGYTVEVSSIDKSSATTASVASAKSQAQSKGASDVGALDGDSHGGTPTGKYVIYAGHFGTQKQAKAAAAKLKKSFPGAIVLHITPNGSGAGAGGSQGSATGGTAATNANTGALSTTQGKHGAAYVKASAKLPTTIGTGGAPPPVDNKKPGGGSGGGTCIGC